MKEIRLLLLLLKQLFLVESGHQFLCGVDEDTEYRLSVWAMQHFPNGMNSLMTAKGPEEMARSCVRGGAAGS